MLKQKLLATCTMAIGLTFLMAANANTITLVTKGASVNGAMLLSCSNEGFKLDPSLAYIKAKKFKADSLYNVYPEVSVVGENKAFNLSYEPRLVDPKLSKDYDYQNLDPTLPLAKIAQVDNTYAYLDADSGVLNEHGLAICLAQNQSALFDKVAIEDHVGVFCAQSLSKIVLQRCKTALEAVHLIGTLIDNYGLYGTGASIVVADYNEAYLIEMLPFYDKKSGAHDSLWIAKKITDGTFLVVADSFLIRSIDKEDTSLIFNQDLIKKLEYLKLLKTNEKGFADWAMSVQAKELYPYYSLRRIWRAFDLVAPSLKLKPYVKDYFHAYPLSVVPEKKLCLQDLMMLHRDTFAGTKFDASTKDSAGFFDSPYTYDVYESERAFNNASVTYTYIDELNTQYPSPIAWFALNTPAENSFAPLTVSELPDAYTKVSRTNYDKSKFWWSSTLVSTLTKAYYSSMIDIVKVKAMESEQKAFDLISEYQNVSCKDFVSLLNANAILLVNKWHNLYQSLLEIHDNGYKLRYADGHYPKFTPVDKYQKGTKND